MLYLFVCSILLFWDFAEKISNAQYEITNPKTEIGLRKLNALAHAYYIAVSAKYFVSDCDYNAI